MRSPGLVAALACEISLAAALSELEITNESGQRRLPAACQGPGCFADDFVGCYQDNLGTRGFAEMGYRNLGQTNSLGNCNHFCGDVMNMDYFAVHWGVECYCSNKPIGQTALDNMACNNACGVPGGRDAPPCLPGSQNCESCGGKLGKAVYATSKGLEDPADYTGPPPDLPMSRRPKPKPPEKVNPPEQPEVYPPEQPEEVYPPQPPKEVYPPQQPEEVYPPQPPEEVYPRPYVPDVPIGDDAAPPPPLKLPPVKPLKQPTAPATSHDDCMALLPDDDIRFGKAAVLTGCDFVSGCFSPFSEFEAGCQTCVWEEDSIAGGYHAKGNLEMCMDLIPGVDIAGLVERRLPGVVAVKEAAVTSAAICDPGLATLKVLEKNYRYTWFYDAASNTCYHKGYMDGIEAAVAHCAVVGASLYTPSSAEEERFVTGTMLWKGFLGEAYTGIMRDDRGGGGDYGWSSLQLNVNRRNEVPLPPLAANVDLSDWIDQGLFTMDPIPPYQYTNFPGGKPYNYKKNGERLCVEVEEYTEDTFGKKKWNPVACDLAHAFICEKKPNFDPSVQIPDYELPPAPPPLEPVEPVPALPATNGAYVPRGNLIWRDDFDGDKVNEDIWLFEEGNGCDKGNCYFGNNEEQAYLRENCLVYDGKLNMIAKRDNAHPYGMEFSSCKLHTKREYSIERGHVEVKAKIVKGPGSWPSIFMLPIDYDYGGWPASGEIDILETVNTAQDVTGSLHYGATFSNDPLVPKGQNGCKLFAGIDYSQDFHLYAVEWTPKSISWFVDGSRYCMCHNWFTTGADKEENPAAPYDKIFELILNLAVGGDWPGKADIDYNNPWNMEVDYVAYYDLTQAQWGYEPPFPGYAWNGPPVKPESYISDVDGNPTPWELPARLGAALFDKGGDKVSFLDHTPTQNTGDGGIRRDYGVEIYEADVVLMEEKFTSTYGAYVRLEAGEWLSWSVRVPQGGAQYNYRVRVSSPNGIQYKVLLNSTDCYTNNAAVILYKDIPATEGERSWEDDSNMGGQPGFNWLPGGDHYIVYCAMTEHNLVYVEFAP
ncbi:unnamed protein product [Chrysoparadoxa australica]